MSKAFAISAFTALTAFCASIAWAGTPPANDTVQNAAVAPVIPYAATADIYYATADASDPPDCEDATPQPINNTVWYNYTPQVSGSVDFTAQPSDTSGYSPYVAAFSGTPGNLQLVKCQNYAQAYDAVRVPVTAGTTYYFETGSYYFEADSGASANISLAASPPADPGAVTVSPQASAYNQLVYDPEGGFFLKHHVVVGIQLSCTTPIDSITVDATVNQGSSTVSGSGTISCATGSGSAQFDLYPIQPYSGSSFQTGPATVDVAAYNFAANYNESVTAAPTYITLTRKPVH